MTSPNEDQPEPASSPADAMGQKSGQLKARAARWARLCQELSAHAAELQKLRDELRPGTTTALRESELAAWNRELERRQAEMQRRQQALQRVEQELRQRQQQLLTWQHELNDRQQDADDERLLRAAELEREAEQRVATAAALTDELHAYDAELRDLAHQLEVETAQLDADLDESPET
jgi:chromosome segregation ATPase